MKKKEKNIDILHGQFLSDCRYAAKLRSETLRGYEASFVIFRKMMPEVVDVSQLTPDKMSEFFKRLETRQRSLANGKMAQGIKASTLATYRNKLNKFFKWLRDRSYIKNDPFLSLPYPKVEYSDRKFLRRDAVEKIFLAIGYTIPWHSLLLKKRNCAMFTILLYCGLRKGELLGLKTADINLERRELLVRGETSKSKRDRYIPVHEMVILALKDYINELKRNKGMAVHLWVSENGVSQFTKHGFKHLVEQLNIASGVKFHVHQFRHTFAANLSNQQVDTFKLKSLLGHSDIRMTTAYLRRLPVASMLSDVGNLTIDKLM